MKNKIHLDNNDDIVCECTSRTFLIHIGEYVVIATCTECGISEEIYSG